MAIRLFEHVEDYLGFLRKMKTKATFKVFHIPLDLSVQTVLRMSPHPWAKSCLGPPTLLHEGNGPGQSEGYRLRNRGLRLH